MVLPIFILIADLLLWWLLADIVDRLPTLTNGNLILVAVFGLAFSVFCWLIYECIDLVYSKEKRDY